MSNIRQLLETKLNSFAISQSPPIPVSYENVPFTKPSTGFIECFLNSGTTENTTIDGLFVRERGVFQVNVWMPSGQGMAKVEEIATLIVKAFPVFPEFGDVKITETGNTSRAIVEISGFIIIPVTFKYRYEGVV